MKEIVRKYVLQNSLKFGKTDPSRIIGKVLGENPSLRGKVEEVTAEIIRSAKEIDGLSEDQKRKEIGRIAPAMLEKRKEEKKELPELRDVGPKVIMRFAPSPSGPMHLGHAYVLGLNSEYCRKYRAKLILRIEDTNASNIDPIAYTQLPEDAKWITKNNISEVCIQSERMETYYDHALSMLEKGFAYICTCSSEGFKKFSEKKQECPCRKNTPEKNIRLWKDMFKKFEEGDAVMRFKTDMKHNNPAMRDFPLMRINDDEHPRTGKKYRVWPLMNFAVTVDDHELGVTHTLRAKDHADNAKRQEFIQHAMGWNVPRSIFVGRINFLDLDLSCSATKERINKGEFSGWDDIRLPFLVALKRRGYQPEAFIRYALDVGVTLTDKKVSKEDFFKAISAFNKEVIDPKAYRYFFVEDPVEITIEGAHEQDVELDLHPENKKGGRKFSAGKRFFVAKKDFDDFREGRLYRLMDCLNFRKEGKKLVFHSKDYERYRSEGAKIIHWLPAEDRKMLVKAEVLMDDGTTREGLAEEALSKVEEGKVVQFERFGFCRMDKDLNTKMVFWWGHR
ncbi:glutamate--tRNA ligase [Candidatus Woesearchaeota archaeon CG10_big_fil_rev_8_21_14_0_10_44_13]|nr:MAG: glutamate--tRNA ligase [Candidatus Woesearchaeota archaeon CG10_big_fil_rev_8_21_14_0_10_44_13]